MASARIHEAIAIEINKDYGFDELLLRIGTVAPDCWRNVKEGVKDKYISHFWDFRVKQGQANNYDEFYFKYYKQLENPIYFGYLIHLIADQYWKTTIDPKYEMELNGVKGFKLKDGSFHDDSNWFSYFESIRLQKKLAKKYQLGYLPIDEKDIPNFSCNIDELNLSGLFGPKGTLDYINTELSLDENDEELQIYDLDDILKYIKETAKFIKLELERLKKKYLLFDKKFKIAIDIDDTLLSTKELERYYWKIFLKDNPNINPNKDYKWGDPELAKFWSEYREKMAFGKIKDGACECINYLLENGCVVDLLTARPIDKYASLKKDLVIYFEKNKLHYNFIHLGLYEKISFLKEHNYNLLIDNEIRHIKEADSLGIETILFGIDNANYSGYKVANWQEMKPLLEMILKKRKKK